MMCSNDGCPGTYESDSVVHTVRHAGQVIVIDHVPADVCSVCGDVLLKPDTVRRIEVLLRETTGARDDRASVRVRLPRPLAADGS